eukprot:jgi/Ulvmu1/7561/UM037_0105.1
MPVLVDPRTTLGQHSNSKHARECTELILGRNGLQHLAGFHAFPNLRSLWINHNNLVTLENLEHNFRLQALHAHHNRICSVKGALSSLRSLKELDLSSNCIRDVEKVQKTLACLQSLEVLNLANNPCCEEAEYRLKLIHAIPSLKILDCHVIWDWERTKAKHVFGNLTQTRFAFGTALPRSAQGSTTVHEQSYHEQAANREHCCILMKRAAADDTRERVVYSHDPHQSDISAIPPRPPGWIQLEPPVAHVGSGSEHDKVSFASSKKQHRCKDILSYHVMTPQRVNTVAHSVLMGSGPGQLLFDAEAYKRYAQKKQMQGRPTLKVLHVKL